MIEKYALFRVLNVFFETTKELTMQEVGKKAQVSIGMVKLLADHLVDEQILQKTQIGKMFLFQLKNSFLTRNLKTTHILLELHKIKVVEEILSKEKENVLSMLLFGSMATGRYDEKSDIDILLVTRKKREKKQLKAEEKIKREISIHAYTYNEWKEKAKKDQVFYEHVLFDSIVLYGEKPIVT